MPSPASDLSSNAACLSQGLIRPVENSILLIQPRSAYANSLLRTKKVTQAAALGPWEIEVLARSRTLRQLAREA